MTRQKTLITGASTGIGAIYADRLARRGHDLVLVARDETRLRALAERLEAETGAAIEILLADLTAPADLARIEARLRDRDDITMLVNNAGAAGGGDFARADPGTFGMLIDLNVTALTRLSAAAASGFVARGEGTIVNLSSVTAFMAETFEPVYLATKAYVLAFSQALHHQLGTRGVRVQAVVPGITRTEIWGKAGHDVDAFPPEKVMDVGTLVDAALAGLDLGEVVTIPSLPDIADWEAVDAARLKLSPNLSRDRPAQRYLHAA